MVRISLLEFYRIKPEMSEQTKFIFVGNNLSLDFINTEIVENGEAKDLLETAQDFLVWASEANLIGNLQAKMLMKNQNDESALSDFFLRAKEFRAILRKTVEQLVSGRKAKTAAIIAINTMLRENASHPEIVPTAKGFEKVFRTDQARPLQLLAPIAESAADLLCYGNPSYLKKCENPKCVLYFYDTTKNHKRHWCSMAACGNRAKASAFYNRRKKDS